MISWDFCSLDSWISKREEPTVDRSGGGAGACRNSCRENQDSNQKRQKTGHAFLPDLSDKINRPPPIFFISWALRPCYLFFLLQRIYLSLLLFLLSFVLSFSFQTSWRKHSVFLCYRERKKERRELLPMCSWGAQEGGQQEEEVQMKKSRHKINSNLLLLLIAVEDEELSVYSYVACYHGYSSFSYSPIASRRLIKILWLSLWGRV